MICSAISITRRKKATAAWAFTPGASRMPSSKVWGCPISMPKAATSKPDLAISALFRCICLQVPAAKSARRQPDAIIEGLGMPDIDAEGRYIEAQFGNLSVVSLYLPSGSSGEERQAFKFGVMARFMPHLEALKASGREVVICGDWNIAHKETDLKNWKGNKKNSGFLPEERAWLTDLFGRVS